jgi:hypothetical protein
MPSTWCESSPAKNCGLLATIEKLAPVREGLFLVNFPARETMEPS